MRFPSLLLTAAAALLLAQTRTDASIYTGSISSPTNLVVGGNWTSGTLAWTVTDNLNGSWNYSYTFTRAPNPDTSHFIIEISTNVTTLTLFQNVMGNFTNFELGQGGAPSNPSIPGNFTNAIKFNFDDPNIAMVSFDIARNPTWGDFYAKGGPTSFAHNSGFVASDANDPVAALANGPHINTAGLAHILVPDSDTPVVNENVPEPSTLLAWVGLTSLATAWGLRKRNLAR